MHFSRFAAALAATVVVSCGYQVMGEPAAPSSEAAAQNEATAAAPRSVITLREAMALALARHPQLAIFPYDLRAADARVLQAGLRPNPELQVEVEEFGGRRERSGFEAAETTVQVGQPIELGGKRAQRTQAASLDKELVQWDYRSARLDVMQEVTQAFVAALAAQERLALAERLLEVSRNAQSAVAQRVRAGKDSPVDELRANVALAGTRIERQKAEKALTAARHTLAAAWGGRSAVFEKVEGDLYEIREPLPLEQTTAAISSNPDVARWPTEEDRRRAVLRLEKARGVPDLTIGGGVRRFEETDDAAFVFGFTLPLPLFDRNQGGVLGATAELAKTRRQSEAAQIATLAALSEAASAQAAAYEEIIILRNDVLPQSQRAFEAAQEGYQQGKFDYLYVLDAQRVLFEMQAQYLNSLEAYHRARADVERLTGGPGNVASDDPSSTAVLESSIPENPHEK
jgi:cobalt-zinc-cadmium efflux system outer membrane protein